MSDQYAVRIRGIYTTALTHLLEEAGFDVVQASAPIRDRFDESFETAPAEVRIETSRDRQGLEVSGSTAGVEAVTDTLEGVAIDTFQWADETPRGAVFDTTVVDTNGGRGATVDLGDGRRGYLPYDQVDGYVDAGNHYRVQVREPTPPWSDSDPRVAPGVVIDGGLCTLEYGETGVRTDFDGRRADEVVGMTDLISSSPPEGWGLRWHRPAADADLETLATALEQARERASGLRAVVDGEIDPTEADGPDNPTALEMPEETVWCWFGRDSRMALDTARREVTTTMAGHHRIKTGSRSASSAVDFAEAVCSNAGDGSFPFGVVSRQFGPTVGDRLELGHGKPDGRLISLGKGDVTTCEDDGSVTLERSMRGGGTYDALGVPIEDGDVAITKLKEGRWWYPTMYKDANGTVKGTYVNICTPVELFPDCARYVDLYIDVIRHADGTVAIVDDEELEAAVEDGLVTDQLAEKARGVATAVERALST